MARKKWGWTHNQEREINRETFYSKSFRAQLLADDELTNEEDGFMQGYEEGIWDPLADPDVEEMW
jgi:hypothetical protein